jgi:hypothetical protein
VVTASAVPPVAVAPSVAPSAAAPVGIAPVALPSAVAPVAVAPVVATIPTGVNAGDGSSEGESHLPVGIALLALASVGVLLSALKLSTRRRATSSRK